MSEVESPTAAPDVVGLAEAAEILGVRARSEIVRVRLRGVPLVEAGANDSRPIWSGEAVRRVAAGKTSTRKPPDTLGLGDVAALLGVSKPNVRQWCKRRGLTPANLKSGPRWLRADIERGRSMTSARWSG